jgi:hypothetical protein
MELIEERASYLMMGVGGESSESEGGKRERTLEVLGKPPKPLTQPFSRFCTSAVSAFVLLPQAVSLHHYFTFIKIYLRSSDCRMFLLFYFSQRLSLFYYSVSGLRTRNPFSVK